MSPKQFRILTSTTQRAFLLSVLAIAGCSASPVGPSENVGQSDQPLLASTCTVTNGNLALTVGDGDVAYIGRIAGCTTEPCVYANAKDSSGNLCTVASTAKSRPLFRRRGSCLLAGSDVRGIRVVWVMRSPSQDAASGSAYGR